ncbi:MAG: T9SS type A sorting domain-containing protein [Flavobacteriales bacterium]|nr:T9SS type A sorting domain-containing protein [Flavobacteriales bacterium]
MKTKALLFLILTLPLFSNSQVLWDDFEQTRVGYYDFVHGGMTTRFPNPDLLSTVNNSNLCAQYVRNPGELWDVLVIIANGSINDVSDYVSGSKTMSIDVFSPASGIPIQITLEDSSIAGATNYPDGRHSIYLGVTTLSNEWETIELTFDSRPDINMSDDGLTSVILLFNGNTNTNDTYYFDNLYAPEFNNQCNGQVLNPAVNLSDWDCNWNLGICPSGTPCASFDYVSGWLNQAYNPDNSTINNSKYSGEYTRNPDPNGEDVLVSYFSEGALDLSVNKYFNFKVYGPPRPIYVSFQDDNNNEIYAYNSALSSNNQWQQFSVDLSSVASQSITRFVMFIDQGVVNWDLYFLDDFNLSSTPLLTNEINESNLINVFPQPAKNSLNIQVKLNNSEINTLDLYNSQGKILSSNVLNKNDKNINLDVSQFKSGIYFIKVHSKNNLYTKKVQIIR